MQKLRYSINVTLDGCVDHREGNPNKATHRHAADTIASADALILGRPTYDLMEQGWRSVAESGVRPEWVDEWMVPFARTIHAAKKYVVSDTLEQVDWNAELVRGGDLETTVRRLKQQPGRGLYVGGVKLPLALASWGLIDEFEFVVHPTIAGHGPTLFAGLSEPLRLEPIGRLELGDGIVATRYVRVSR